MKAIASGAGLVVLICAVAGGCGAQAPSAAPSPQAGDVAAINQPVPVTMTRGEFKALLKSGDKRTGGLAILWLHGYYAGCSGLSELPVGWVRTVSQGVGGTCAISVNEQRTVLDVVGQIHREYGSQK